MTLLPTSAVGPDEGCNDSVANAVANTATDGKGSSSQSVDETECDDHANDLQRIEDSGQNQRHLTALTNALESTANGCRSVF